VNGYGAFVVNNIRAQGHKDKMVDVLAGGPVFDPPIGRERVDWDPTTKAWRSVKLGHGGDIRVTKSFQKLKTDIASGRVNVRW
jgi:hypothetical protein